MGRTRSLEIVKTSKETKYHLQKTIEVTKEEYINQLKQDIEYWNRRAFEAKVEGQLKIEKYTKKIEKDVAEYKAISERKAKELTKLEVSE